MSLLPRWLYDAVVRGASRTGTEDGATFIVGPMTPAKLLLVCLEAYSSGSLGGGYADWNDKPPGKVNLDWELHLDAFNLALRNAGRRAAARRAAARAHRLRMAPPPRRRRVGCDGCSTRQASICC